MLLVKRQTLLLYASIPYLMYVALLPINNLHFVYNGAHNHLRFVPLQRGYLLMIESSVVTYYNPSEKVSTTRPNDETFVEIPANALGQCSPPQTYPSEIHANVSVTIHFSYSLGCSPNYQLCTVNTTLQCVCAEECINGKSYTACVKTSTSLLSIFQTIKKP